MEGMWKEVFVSTPSMSAGIEENRENIRQNILSLDREDPKLQNMKWRFQLLQDIL
jgi:hypothetical protein